jgi:hypothetical protein
MARGFLLSMFMYPRNYFVGIVNLEVLGHLQHLKSAGQTTGWFQKLKILKRS